MSTKKHYLFIVFNDPIVVGALQFLRSCMNNGRAGAKPHLTIQGPFEEKVELARVRSVKKVLENDVIFIGNPGVFDTPNGKALYLSVSSPSLRRVWNKPDYPVEKYGFNPHITLYEGSDVSMVSAAHAFLKKNRMELLCRDFEVVQYVPKQADMFLLDGADADDDAIGKLMSRGSVMPSFRARFLSAVNKVAEERAPHS